MSTLYFITHPNVAIDPDVPVPEWSLSEVGTKRMHEMLSLEWVSSIQKIYSSTEKKATDGAQILGDKLGLLYTEIEALGENDRSATGYLPAAEFESIADQFFAVPTESVRGWETAQDAQTRIVQAVQSIIEVENDDAPTAIISHGAVGTLLLSHLNNWPISREHDQPANGGGNYFSFDTKTFEVHHGWIAIDEK